MKSPSAVDMRAFNSCLTSLARFAGVSVDRAISYESGKVLESAIRYTPAADLAKMRDKSNNRTYTQFCKGGKKYNLSYRYPDALWARISAQRQEHFRIMKRARGLAKQSWFNLAGEVGLKISAPSYVGKAIATSGKTYPGNARAQRVHTQGRWAIYFENSQPTACNEYVGGRRALAAAFNSRLRYFEQNLRRGVFAELSQIAKRYPGLTVT